jgi:FimV-like protein
VQPGSSATAHEAAAKRSEPLDQMIDEDITIAPSAARDDMLAGAGNVHDIGREKSTDALSTAFKASSGAASVAIAGAMASGKSMADAKMSTPTGDAAGEAGKYDLDFHLDDADKVAPFKRDTPAPAATGATSTSPQLARPAAALELDKLDLSFDPDRTTFEDPTPSVLDGQWHDAATKLDLAKAYQEMGDVEGAREILQEVLHEGDEQQKTEAQSLLAKLG